MNQTNTNNVFMLTTKDNPYNPYTHWDEWYAFDHEKGYCTCEYLDRIAMTSPDMSDDWNDEQIVQAINDIIRIDPTNNYTRFYKDTGKEESTDPVLVKE